MRWFLLIGVALALAGCDSDSGSGGADPAPGPSVAERDEQSHPDVVDVSVERTGETFAFEVTISSPYDTPDRYADGWRVLGPDGTVHGEHTLAHDHANEQPFTRTQTDVEIPDGVDEVTVEGRDSEHGYGGDTVTVPLPSE
ncbi:hypothetical protein [Phytoactinopolyspora endophytica]|uniref:hypothetical protein n=1 Tax=Phytoactinopolyspora endophytica TaxID=1642495 RepID=UPI00101DB1CE|nr:hypothetical protein [Phytoactinopolyspora endophytica]